MISLTNYDFQWARSELVIIYPGTMPYKIQHGLVKSTRINLDKQWTLNLKQDGRISILSPTWDGSASGNLSTHLSAAAKRLKELLLLFLIVR